MQTYTDEQLVEIYQRNKDGRGQLAFYHLYQRYANCIYNYFYFSLNNDANKAQDMVQDVFLRIIEKQQSIDKNKSFKAWVYTMASNMCKNEFRSQQVMEKYTRHIQDSEISVQSATNDSKELLRNSISELRQEHRSLIVLRFKMKLSIKEIADIYECPEGTIKSRLFYATKELTNKCKQHGYGNT